MTQEYYQQRLDGQNVCAISSKGHGIKMCHSFFFNISTKHITKNSKNFNVQPKNKE